MILERVKTHKDVKRLTEHELHQLADEIRKRIIDVVTRNGGHLGSNLGVIELTLAMHYEFDADNDVFVWDGSYQTYAHKLLTGRNDRFDTLRTLGGISGFGYIPESPYDPFSLGHVGTSLALAHGLAQADKKSGKNRKVVCLIGDGAMTAGVAYEALNCIGSSNDNVIVILNDNGFSIAPTVGAISKYLNTIRTSKEYDEVKHEVKELLLKIPFGQPVEKFLEKVKERIKHFVYPNLFTAMGFQYYGPVDGHYIKGLVQMFHALKEKTGPVLIHVITEKGKGYPGAENDPFGAHKPVEPKPRPRNADMKIEPNEFKIKEGKSFTKTTISLIKERMKSDNRVVAITAAMPDGTGLLDISADFPDDKEGIKKRVYDVGISEQCAVAFAAGLAKGGMRPVVAIYSSFLQRAYDQIFQELCLQNMPVVLLIDRGGIVGEDGPTHHGLFDIAFLRTFPNIKVVSPTDERELREMLDYAFENDGPVALRIPRENVPDLSEFYCERTDLEEGAPSLAMKGKRGLILSYGIMTKYAIMARKKLQLEGIEPAIASGRFAKPLNADAIKNLIEDYEYVLCVEDHSYLGGYGSAVMEAVSMAGGDTSKIKLLAAPDMFIEHGSRAQLLEVLGMDEFGIADAVRTLHVNPATPSLSFIKTDAFVNYKGI